MDIDINFKTTKTLLVIKGQETIDLIRTISHRQVAEVLGYVHTAPFLFLSVFVDENAARSHCSIFK